MQEAPHQVSFPKIEEDVLKKWEQGNFFQRSVSDRSKIYSFYDGPPFATGLPHYGHLLASTLKDIVPRYWTMKGFRVERRWGWDCHGLPIEQEIDKKFHFKSTEEIEKFGIANYNRECREIVMRFVTEWRQVISRLGRWVDFDNDYKTMDLKFMESVWWVIGELWKKGLIYRGYKVMPFSTALGTPLSNFEAGSNYQDVQDPAITISFPLEDNPSRIFLAWTTTPWTLPSNLALAVGEDVDYVEIEGDSQKTWILAEALAEKFFKKDQIKIVQRFKGSELVGIRYIPLFPYFSDRERPYFTVLSSGHVTTDSGTGIVHMAPAFGEDDYIACSKKDIKPVCPVDSHGKFTSEISHYKGLYVKDADKQIIADLKAQGRLFKQDTLQHAYPFCPRTDTPLIYRIVASWFVKVEAIKDKLVENNQKYTHWIPEHLRDGRFGKWLEGARDWAISRNRYWGNPLPIFESIDDPEDKKEFFCISSVSELEKIAGRKFSDIHREFLDDLVIEKNGKKFKRVPEVLDCWFESGAMPYAQQHYPFENKEEFEKSFPAQFIGEGLDQTRGWFYTLSVLGTILFDRPPFQNVIVNGLILAEDGKKMSKRLKNYPDPTQIMNTHGADALRLYMIDSPVIRAEELRFSENGVREIVRRVILKWWNAYSFFESYAAIDRFRAPEYPSFQSKNILDQWILSRLQSLLLSIEKEMKAYRLYNVVPQLLVFIEDLTNIYIRLNRGRFWEEGLSQDKTDAFQTLHFVLKNLSLVMAPFTPFLSDYLFDRLTEAKIPHSVHLENYPVANEKLIHPALESGVSLMEEAIVLARNLRDQLKAKVKVPLKEMTVINRFPKALEDLKLLESYLKSELNVRKISYRSDEASFVKLEVKPNGATLGPKAGSKMGALTKAISQLSFDQIQELDSGKSLSLEGIEITSKDLRIFRNPVSGNLPTAASSKIIVALDPAIERDQELEGLAREVVNRVQKLRKDSQLNLDDRIHLEIATKGPAQGDLAEAVHMFRNYIQDQTLSLSLEQKGFVTHSLQGQFEIDGTDLVIGLKKA